MGLIVHAYSNATFNDGVPDCLARVNGGSPSWLLSPFVDDRWTITDTGDKANRTISFAARLPNKRNLSDYPNLVDSAKRISYGIRTGPLMTIENGSSQYLAAQNLLLLARWMINRGIQRFDELTPLDIRDYEAACAFGVFSILNVEGILQRHLESLADKANFSPSDSADLRFNKAKAVYPLIAMNAGNQYRLNRRVLLNDAGLEGIGLSRHNAAVTRALDEVEASAGFYLHPRVRRRLTKACEFGELDEKPVHATQIRAFLQSFEYLFTHRRYLEDAVHFSPFPSSSPGAEALVLGREGGKTCEIPLLQGATAIERSCRWVLHYAPAILEMKSKVDTELNESNINAPARAEISSPIPTSALLRADSPFPLLPRLRAFSERPWEEPHSPDQSRGMALTTAIQFLIAACTIVIAAFSARRAAEILGLKVNCIQRDAAGKPWLRVFIHKAMRVTVIPVPEIVVLAVSVLEQISERARAISGSQYLFQFNRPGSLEIVGLSVDGKPALRIGEFVKRFCYFLDVPPLPDGTRWTFRLHQFRRLFVLLWVHVWELGDYEALRDFLGHFRNNDALRRYAFGEGLGQFLALADRERVADVIADAALGGHRVAGDLGVRLVELAKHLYRVMARHVEVMSERRFRQRLLGIIVRTGVKLTGFPWGYCGYSAGNVKGGCNCSKGAAPDFEHAGVSTCGDCPHNVRPEWAIPYLKSGLEFHRSIADSESPDVPIIFKRASRAFCNDITRYMLPIVAVASADAAK